MSETKEGHTRSGVGYGRPPLHTRFRKGQSGNPTGKRRHQAERVEDLFWNEANRVLTVREGDKVSKVRALPAVFRSQFAQALKGNVAAQRAVLGLARELTQEARARHSGGGNGKINIAEMSDDELMAWLQGGGR
jgi:Family of unknown function (DUF5681)